MIKKCKCGSKRFTSFETLMVSGVMGNNGELLWKSSESLGIDEYIICQECGEEHTISDFKEIKFIN